MNPLEDSSLLGANRNEKKARKTIGKLDLKAIPKVKKIVVKRGGNSVLFIVNNPDVFLNPGTHSYVFFGPPSSLGEEQASNFAQAAKNLSPDMINNMNNSEKNEKTLPVENETEQTESIDTSDLNQRDIELIMEQAKVSYNVAAKTLKQNDNDVVNAIMELTV